jgi:hypothetical protein
MSDDKRQNADLFSNPPNIGMSPAASLSLTAIRNVETAVLDGSIGGRVGARLNVTFTIGAGLVDVASAAKKGQPIDVAIQSGGIAGALAGGWLGGVLGAQAGGLAGALLGPGGAAFGAATVLQAIPGLAAQLGARTRHCALHHGPGSPTSTITVCHPG